MVYLDCTCVSFVKILWTINLFSCLCWLWETSLKMGSFVLQWVRWRCEELWRPTGLMTNYSRFVLFGLLLWQLAVGTGRGGEWRVLVGS